MILAKHFFANSEGFSIDSSNWNHALAKYACKFLPFAWSCAIVVLYTASVVCYWYRLASGLPTPPGLAAACPSPPGLAPGLACPSPPEMISWFLFSWLGLELHLASKVFAGDVCMLQSKSCCCSCCGAVWDMWALLPWYYPPGQMLGICWLLRCCQHRLCMQWLSSLSCLSPGLDLIHVWPCCVLLCAQRPCTPVGFD
jgi:hypothetical protein